MWSLKGFDAQGPEIPFHEPHKPVLGVLQSCMKKPQIGAPVAWHPSEWPSGFEAIIFIQAAKDCCTKPHCKQLPALGAVILLRALLRRGGCAASGKHEHPSSNYLYDEVSGFQNPLMLLSLMPETLLYEAFGARGCLGKVGSSLRTALQRHVHERPRSGQNASLL